MKYSRLIYSRFSIETTSLLDVWCLLMGMVLVVIVTTDTGAGFSGDPQAEGFLAIGCPAVYYLLNQFARRYQLFKYLLLLATLTVIGLAIYFELHRDFNRSATILSTWSICLFSAISFLLALKIKINHSDNI